MWETIVKILGIWFLISFLLFGGWMLIREYHIRKNRREDEKLKKQIDDKIFAGLYGYYNAFDK